jgi:AcrR family transcriptional regulator
MNNYFQSKASLQPKKDRTRAAIIDSAINIIAKKGFQKSSIQEMAKNAGIANGTFYNHYKDRKSIFEDVANLIAIELVKVIEEDEIKTKKPAQKLINATNQFINRSVQVPEWGTIFLEAADFSVRLEKDISRYLIKDIKSGIRDKSFLVKYDDFLVEQIMIIILHSISHQLENGIDKKITNKTINTILRILNYKR